jgi:hypothetical protein
VSIVDLDLDSLARMGLEGQVCVHVPLLEDEILPGFAAGECRMRAQDLEPLVRDELSGVKLAVKDGNVAGYAVFGRPGLFRYLERLPFEVDESALLVAAFFVFPGTGEEQLDAELLVDVMEFARGRGYRMVQAVCRAGDAAADGPEGDLRFFAAAGFAASEPVRGLCLAQVTLDEWDKEEDEEALDNRPEGQ